MVTAGDFRNGVTFEEDGNVMQIVEFQHVKPGKGAAFVRAKVRNVISGSVVEKTYNPTAKFPTAYVERKDMEYSYNDGDLYYFMDPESYELVPVNKAELSDNFKFVKENMVCKILSYKGTVFGVEPPYFVDLEVTETEPGIKGDTATNATKPATVETGAEIRVPLFINTGDRIRIDTRTCEYNAEYNPFFIKSKYPEMIEEFNIPLDEYPRRCIKQIEGWEKEREDILKDGKIGHERSKEYASYIMEAVVTNTPYKIGGNVLNNGYIDNLPSDACVEVPCYIDGTGVHPVKVGKLPTQLAAMNSSNVSPQLLAIEAAVTKDRQKIYQAAMMDPHTGAELNIKDIQAMCDELIEAHGDYMKMYR